MDYDNIHMEWNIIILCQVLNNRQQEILSRNNEDQTYVKIEESVIEDARFPEKVAKELVIKDGTVTQISGGQYNGFIQVIIPYYFIYKSIKREV